MSFQAPPRSPRYRAYDSGSQWFRPQDESQPPVSYADQSDDFQSYPGQRATAARGWEAQSVMSQPVYATADEVFSDEPAWGPRRPGVLIGAMAGLLAAALGGGVATLVAAFVRPQASPLISVGEPFIDRVPQSLMNLAAQHFGSHGGMAALAIVAATIAVVAIIIGMIAIKRPAAGVTGIILISVLSAFAVITRPMSHPADVIPSVIGGVAGVAVLMWLIRAAYSGIRR